MLPTSVVRKNNNSSPGTRLGVRIFAWMSALLLFATTAWSAAPAEIEFPRPLDSYAQSQSPGLWDTLVERVQAEPFNLIATIIFFLAILHTFAAARFQKWAHAVEHAHEETLANQRDRNAVPNGPAPVSFKGKVLHFFGEVEAIFGIWVLVLLIALAFAKGWGTVTHYMSHVNFTEPMFVVVIMALASTRPVLLVAEASLRAFARIGRESVAAWWLSILIIAPLLGSFITEPAAMTIAALLLARQFYELKPSPRFAYATIGLLFVNISVGGTLTHFAAPPVLMVAAPWNWDIAYMFTHFGWRAATGIVVATTLYALVFRKEFAALQNTRTERRAQNAGNAQVEPPVPAWITATQIGFMAFTVFVAHYPALFIGGFLFFIAFSQATAHHQGRLELRSPMLVGFFLAGLVTHGGLQAWWIEPVLSRLGEMPLFLGATALTAVNDNAAITYLATLVPGFTEELKYAVVAGAVTGGGLTVIANAPNPAGQSILQRFFPNGVSPLNLLVAALAPTVIMALAFMAL